MFLHHIFFNDKKEWLSIWSIVSSSNLRLSSTTPNEPLRLCRPALPAICAISGGLRYLGIFQSNLVSDAKDTRSISIFRPMPIASVAIK